VFSLVGFLHGARRAFPLALSGAPFGLVVGVLAGRAGLTVWELLAMSALVFAGSSQLVAISMWASPVPVLAPLWILSDPARDDRKMDRGGSTLMPQLKPYPRCASPKYAE
jgi:hypothetical protein